MTENEARAIARDNQQSANNETRTEKAEEKGPTEKLREQAKPDAQHLVPAVEVPGVQKQESRETKKETNPNTE